MPKAVPRVILASISALESAAGSTRFTDNWFRAGYTVVARCAGAAAALVFHRFLGLENCFETILNDPATSVLVQGQIPAKVLSWTLSRRTWRNQLGKADREKLDEYFTSIWAEQKLSLEKMGQC